MSINNAAGQNIFQDLNVNELVGLCMRYMPQGISLTERELSMVAKNVNTILPSLNRAMNSIITRYESALNGEAGEQEIEMDKVMSIFMKEVGPSFQKMMSDYTEQLEAESGDGNTSSR